MSSLGQRSLDAVLWGAGGTVLRALLQFVGQVWMARLLGPENYGLFAIGVTVIGLAGFLSDFGLAYGLIQRPQVTERDLRFVMTWQLVCGAFIAGGLALLAPLIAAGFGKPDLVPVVQALSLVCLINACSAVSLNMLKRDLDYRSIQFAQLPAYVIAYFLVGVPMAIAGFGVMSLVVAWILQAVVVAAVMYARVRHPLLPLWRHEDARSMLSYGGSVFLTNASNWMIGNIDRVAAGRLFSVATMGLYATAYNLVYMPASMLLGILQSVAFSAGARMQDDPQRLRQLCLNGVGIVSVFVLPVFASIALASDSLVAALYGQKWLGAGDLLQPLALAMPWFLWWGMATPLLWNSGRIRAEFALQLPIALLWIVLSAIAAHHSVQALAWCVLVLFVVRAGVVLVAASRAVGIALRDLVSAICAGVPIAGLCAALIALVEHFSAAAGTQPAIQTLALDVLAGAAGWLLAMRILRHRMPTGVRGLIAKLTARLPQSLRSTACSALGGSVS